MKISFLSQANVSISQKVGVILAFRSALESSLSHTPCKAVQLLESHGTLIAQIVFFCKTGRFYGGWRDPLFTRKHKILTQVFVQQP